MSAEGEAEKAAEIEEQDGKAEAKAEVEKEEPKEAAKPKEPAKPKELEEDAAEETRPKLSPGTAGISGADATLNVMPTGNGKLLMTLMEGGLQYLLAGARTTVGVKSGRYLIEVKIVESHKSTEPQNVQGRVPMPRNLVRLGLSHAGTSLFLGDGSSDNICFDSEGFFMHEKNRRKVTNKTDRDSTMGLLINLDESSPNANTVSFFRNGTRACEPQPIPQSLRGKALYPTITYKNVTLQVNCGASPLGPLPFKCHMLSEAAVDDVEVASVPAAEGGKHEVVFPVGLPEQGFFDWVDAFLVQHPEFVELSDRKILDWAAKSGLWRPKTPGTSTDKPDMKFGIPFMDDFSIRRMLQHIAPTARRSFVVPELRANLLATERKQALSRFPASEFKRTAAVIVGEPTAEFKEQVQGLILADKKTAAEAEVKKKREEEVRKKMVEEKRKKAEELRKAKLKKKDGEEEEAPAEEKAEETKEEPMEVEVELTAEEKTLWYRKMQNPDITDQMLSKCYTDFSFPAVDEGFDDISYKWQGETEAAKLLKDWVFKRKLTQRVEDITPGTWFKEEWPKWTKALQEWRKKQNDWKDPTKKKALLAARAEAKKKEAEEKGDEAPQDMEIDPDEIDVSSVEDVTDIGSGEPLFSNFSYEDWAMLSARFEFHLLLLSFKKDIDDPDRPSFTTKDLPFYYNKYFKKAFNIRTFGLDKVERLVDLMKDTVKINSDSSFLTHVLDEDTPISQFVKLSEDHRRERQRRMDAGDETAELKFPRVSTPAQRPGAPAPVQTGMVRGGPGMVPRVAVAATATFGAPASTPVGAQKRVLTPVAASMTSSYVAKQPRTSPYGSGYNRK